jgi:hypothetical protein
MSRILTLTVTATAPAVSIDAWRFAKFGASATDPSIAGDMADPDGDGYTNRDEFNFGSDPLNRASVPGAVPPLRRQQFRSPPGEPGNRVLK